MNTFLDLASPMTLIAPLGLTGEATASRFEAGTDPQSVLDKGA